MEIKTLHIEGMASFFSRGYAKTELLRHPRRIMILWISVFLLLGSDSFSQVLQAFETPDTTYTPEAAGFELLAAASEGDTARIITFLDLGTDVNTTTWDGVTPLMLAAQGGHLRAVEILIDRGADVSLKPYNHIDALLGAAIAGHVLVADTLILNGANVNTRNLDGVTPLMYAAAYDDQLLADVLLFYGARVAESDNFGNTALHFSSFYGNNEISNLLIDRGANLEATDRNGFTPLMCAAQNGHLSTVGFLLEAGCDLAATNNYNCDALALAIINRFVGVAELLLSKGADASRMIAYKTNPYELSEETADKEMTSMIEQYGGQPLQKFRVNRMVVGYDLNWNNKDVMMGGSLRLEEAHMGWEAELGYRTRPWVRSVRYTTDQQITYQFWEKRSLLYLGAGKKFILARVEAKETFGAFVSANIGYTYGSFRGSERNPDDNIVFIPRGGLYYTFRGLSMKLNYEYLKTSNSNIPPHRINLSIGAGFNLIRSVFRTKKEPRL